MLYTSNLFSNLEINNNNVAKMNDMNTGAISNQAEFKNIMMGAPSLGDNDSDESSMTGIMPKMGNSQKAISIQTTKLAVASKNVTDGSLKNMAKIMNDFCSKNNISKINLVGHSYGAGIAIQAACDFKDLIESLTLISPIGLGKEIDDS